MKPAPFEYYRPATLDEALTLLARHQDAKPLAGGQSLIPAMNFRLATPAILVDLGRLEALRGIAAVDRTRLSIGAMATHAMVEHDPLVAQRTPLLAEAMPCIAHPQIRNRGTVGGSLAHADPAAELPAVMVALGATLVLQSESGERRVLADQFFTGLFATALEAGELVVRIELPSLPERSGWAFEELARRHGDYALVGVAAVLAVNSGGRCTGVRIVLLSVGDGPVQATRAMASLDGETPGPEAIRAAAELAAADLDPPSDIHASAAYRRQLARVLTRRALLRAAERTRVTRDSR